VRKFRPLGLLVVGILVYSLAFSGCSGSGTIAVTLSTSETSLNPGQTATIIATLTNDRTDAGVTWTLTGPGTLSGNTTTSVVYTAPSTVAVATSATITATSVANTTITSTQSISLVAVLTITTTSLPAGILGVAYDSFINAAGAPAPFTWTIISGSLPPGLTFQTTSTSTSAEITGTPTVLGTSNFTVQVEDSSDAIVTQALSIVINKPPPLSVATGSLPNGIVNAPYSQTLAASSGVQPYTWSLVDGTVLPVGLSLDATSGVISGTPIATGSFPFTVQVTDSSTPKAQIATANLSITINPGVTNNGRLSGNYAFSVRGFDASGLFIAAGSFFADGSGNISAGIMDTNDTVNPLLNQSFNGTYSIGQNGLGLMTLNTTPSRTFALSMMANGSANIIEFDDSTGGGTRDSGVLLKQDTSAFSTAPTNGNYAFGFLGIDSSENRFGLAGAFVANSGSFSSGTLDSDSSSLVSSNVPFTGGGYTAASLTNGRGTANIMTAQGTTGYSFYVVSATQLLVMETDTFSTQGFPLVSGTILQQTTSSFGPGNLNGTGVFEVTALNAATAESQVGLFAGNGGGSFSLTSDQNSGGTLTSPAGTGTYSVASGAPANGRVTFPSGSGFQNSLPVLYLVTTNQAFIIGTDSAVSFGFMTPQSGSPFTAASLSGTYAGGSLAPVDPTVSNVASIAIAGSGAINVTADVSSTSGLSQTQTSGTTSVASSGRAVLTVNGNTTNILYMVLPSQYFSLATDSTARVDNFAQ